MIEADYDETAYGDDRNTSADQYGDPAADRTIANSDRFDKAATLAALEDPVTGHPGSLQAQVLRAGLIARSYPVTEATNPQFVNSFFNSKVEDTIANPLLGNYVFSLEVSDGTLTSEIDSVTVLAFSNSTPPNALAGKDQIALAFNTVQLDGNASNDADNAPFPLSYQWRFVSVPATSGLTNTDILSANSAMASFTPDVEGQFELELLVSDGAVGNKDIDTIVITVVNADASPYADAGTNHSQANCSAVALNGGLSFDADGLPSALSYKWNFVSLPTGSTLLSNNIQNHSSANATFTPDRYGSYVLELQVNDGEFSSADNVLIDVGSDPNLDGEVCL